MAYQSYPHYATTPSYAIPPSNGYYPPPTQHYQPALPPPQIAPHDPFRAYYADRLRELTFNSRPLIQELSLLAMQQRDSNQWTNMTAVVEEIEGAVYRSPAHEKLPKLYLLDSISKNVGAPYTTHLLQHTVPRLYIRTHREVDGVTRVKMEEMISLWRRSGPDGGELYGPAAREAVEREIFGGQQRMHVPPAAAPPVRETISRDSVLGAIRSMIGVKQGEAAQRVWDRSVQTQLTALMALSEMINTRHVQPVELQQIMDQLRGMGYQPPLPPPPPTMQSYQPPRSALPPFPPTPIPHQSYPNSNFNPAPALPPFAPTMHTSFEQQRQTPPYPGSTPLPAIPTLPPAQTPSLPVFDANMLSILNSLTGSGGLSVPGKPADIKPVIVQPPARTKLDDYEDMVLSLNLSLSNLDMNRMTALPLDHLSVQCSQCAARFPSDGDELNSHMDWHVRRNKQERTSSGRGAHRRWLPRAEEWINDIPVAGSSTAPDTLAGAAAVDSAGATAQAKPLKSVEELSKKWVRVPPGPGNAGQTCPVCKEGFKREWSESEEEWVWRNAIDIAGKIMHATCRQQQLTANRLARVSKGRSGSTGTSSKSPGMTPEAEGLVVKSEPHPLSNVVNATSGSGSEGPESQPPLAVNGDSDKQEVQVEEPVVKQEDTTVAVESAVPPTVESVAEEKKVSATEEEMAEALDTGSAMKRKADESDEEERKRVKVDATPDVGTEVEIVETNEQVETEEKVPSLDAQAIEASEAVAGI